MHGLLRQTAGRLLKKLNNESTNTSVSKDLVDALVSILPDDRLCTAYSKALDGLKVSRAALHRHSVVSPDQWSCGVATQRREEWAKNIHVLNGAITVSELRAAGFDPEHPPALGKLQHTVHLLNTCLRVHSMSFWGESL